MDLKYKVDYFSYVCMYVHVFDIKNRLFVT